MVPTVRSHPFGTLVMDYSVAHTYPSQPVLPEIHPAETLESLALKEVLEAWQLLRGPARLPGNPIDMLRYVKPHIKHLHLSEVIEDGTGFRFRIVGEAVFPGLKESLVGKLVSEHPDPGIGLRFSKLMAAAYDTAAPVRGVSIRLTGDETRNYRIESVWLPFGTRLRVKQIVGMSTFMLLQP